MVGLVLVSHSRALADALRTMALQMAGGGDAAEPLPIAVAAGAGEDGAELGTDATAILAAVEAVMSPDGVLVLLDLGSALLSAELAFDLLDEILRPRVVLCAAPLVEGALAAAAQIGIGADLRTVCAEAEAALRPKREHLGTDGLVSEPVPTPVSGQTPPDATGIWQVDNVHGLHARPATRIVQALAPFSAGTVVEVENLRTNGASASAHSLVALSCLDVRAGDKVRVSARGLGADAALRVFGKLHAEHFGESSEAGAPPAANPPPAAMNVGGDNDGVLRGLAVSPGVALGPALFLVNEVPELPVQTGSLVPATEVARLRDALASLQRELAAGAAALAERLGSENAAILQTHATLAADPSLVALAVTGIERDGLDAARAWQQACRETADTYRTLDNPLLRERARDVEDLATQGLRELGVVAAARLDLPAGASVVLAVSTLLPSEVAALSPVRVLGVVAESVGPTSHTAVLLRAVGVPVVDGVSPARLRAAGMDDGAAIALDGATGEVWVRPDETILRDISARQEKAIENTVAVEEQLAAGSLSPVQTRDGRRIELAANVGRLADAQRAARAGAEAIGLVRTEFLFLNRATAPTEDEQTAALRALAEALRPGTPMTVRTLDVGGDKPISYLASGAPEDNPFLGVRGLRLTLRRVELFSTHLRAILRAGAGARNSFRVMFPMVTDVEEVRRARTLLAEAHAALAGAGVPHAWPVETGIMVEVPAAALNARALAAEVDFFSVGTNDLTQYTLAAERNHPALQNFADALHPAVLRLIAAVVRAAHRAGGDRWVGVCGEAAADASAARVFLGLGVRELSVGPAALAATRQVIVDTDFSAACALARHALLAPSAEVVRAICKTPQVAQGEVKPLG